MLRTTRLLAALVAAGCMSSAFAAPTWLADSYTGAKMDNSTGKWAQSSTDAIGGSAYDLQGMSVDYAKATHLMTVTVDAGAWRKSTSIDYGDLFIHLGYNVGANSNSDRSDLSGNGWSDGTADAGTMGTDWNDANGFVFDTSANAVYGSGFGVTYSGSTSNPVSPGANGRWNGISNGRAGQEVERNTGGTAVNGAAQSFSVAADGKITYTFDMQKIASVKGINLDQIAPGALDVGLRWTMSCANDVLQAHYKVPEPGALFLLLGAGLAASAIRRKNQR